MVVVDIDRAAASSVQCGEQRRNDTLHALHPLLDACGTFVGTSFWQGTPPKFGNFDWRDPLDLGSQLTDEERDVQVGKIEPCRTRVALI